MLAHLHRLGWIPLVLSFTKTYVAILFLMYLKDAFLTGFFLLDIERDYDYSLSV